MAMSGRFLLPDGVFESAFYFTELRLPLLVRIDASAKRPIIVRDAATCRASGVAPHR